VPIDDDYLITLNFEDDVVIAQDGHDLKFMMHRLHITCKT
jgi:hypothetical protein